MSDAAWEWLTLIALIVSAAAVFVTHCICDSLARIAIAKSDAERYRAIAANGCGCGDDDES